MSIDSGKPAECICIKEPILQWKSTQLLSCVVALPQCLRRNQDMFSQIRYPVRFDARKRAFTDWGISACDLCPPLQQAYLSGIVINGSPAAARLIHSSCSPPHSFQLERGWVTLLEWHCNGMQGLVCRAPEHMGDNQHIEAALSPGVPLNGSRVALFAHRTGCVKSPDSLQSDSSLHRE